jgi:hypothetical protein
VFELPPIADSWPAIFRQGVARGQRLLRVLRYFPIAASVPGRHPASRPKPTQPGMWLGPGQRPLAKILARAMPELHALA